MDPNHLFEKKVTIFPKVGSFGKIERLMRYSRETSLLGYWPRPITLGTLKMAQTILFQIPKSISRS